MLGHGEHHRVIPRDQKGAAEVRLALRRLAAGDDAWRQHLIRWCREDILFFINGFVCQFNPKKKGHEVGLFLTWDFQEAALLDRPETTGRRGILWYYEHDRTCVVEKSREMGASWLFLIFQCWLGLFFDRTQSLNISKSADAVDCRSPDSLFWKIRFIHEHLPKWMVGEVVEQKMYIEYKRTRSVATGNASTDRAGVGGRAGVIFVDEFSEIKEDQQVRSKTASTSDCRFFNGTHKGIETEFYNLVRQADADDGIGKIVMHWSQHPDKQRGLYRVRGGAVEVLDPAFKYAEGFAFDVSGKPTGGPHPGLRSPWYDQKCKEIGNDRDVAMQLDINPQGAMSQFFNALVIRELQEKYAAPPLWEGDVVYDRDTGGEARLVKRRHGLVRLWVMPDGRGDLPRSVYTAGADIANGVGSTPSVLTVFDAELGKKVLEYADATLEPTPFAKLCYALLSLFRDESDSRPRFCWENVGPGGAFTKRMIELGYSNYYRRSDELPASIVPRVYDSPGWNSGIGSNKKVMLEEYRTALAEGEFENPSYDALEECLAFRYTAAGGVDHAGQETTDPAAARMNHGDRVIADGLAWKMARAMGLKRRPLERPKPPSLNSMYGRMKWREAEEQNGEWDE